jgi:CheY-like chemotaxis protein
MMRSPKTLWDQLDNRQIIRDRLAPTEYEITETENGEEALTAIRLAEKLS